MENPKLEIHILNGPEEGIIIPVETLPCTLGRSVECGIVLADPLDPPGVSREHCSLRQQSGGIYLADHSTNGTFVGRTRLSRGQGVVLPPEEILRLGPTLKLRLAEAKYASTDSSAMGTNFPILSACDFRRQLTAPETLKQAWQRVYLNRGAAGPDNVTVQDFALSAPQRLQNLAEELNHNRYQPLPPRLFAAPKRSGGVRTIAILTVQDRIVQQAVHSVLLPHLESMLPQCSFAYRPGVGAHTALRQLESLLQRGHHWIAETDIAAFFDSISHRILLNQIEAIFPDPFLLSLIARCFSVCAITPRTGIPQGAATSPLFSNLYLAEFDRFLLATGRNPVRYADDFVCVSDTRGEAQVALAEAEGFLRSRLNLTLKAEKTGVKNLAQGFQFLGFQFDMSGRQPAPEALIRKEELIQAARPDEIAAKMRGWENYYGKPEPCKQPEESADSTISSDDEETLLRYLELFGGREDCYARQGKKGDQRTFVPCSGALSLALLRQHIAGQESFASYLLRQDGCVRQIVLDIDAVRRPGRPAQENIPPETLQSAFNAALELGRVCRSFGVPCALVESGQKGRHLWICFAEPVEPERARRLGRLLAKHAGFPKEGVRLEILPRQSEWAGAELGDAITLPLGVHPVTGRSRFFLDKQGDPVSEMTVAIQSLRSITAEELENILARLTQTRTEPALNYCAASETPEIESLVSGCSVLQAIQRKAAETGHLRHTHQLILLYTAGHLGEAGAKFIHQTISLCRNYEESICQKYIDRLEPKHPPISCRRIREWLEEEGETGWCTCGGAKKSPLDSVPAGAEPVPPRKRSSPFALPEKSVLAEDSWREIAGDLFEE